MDLRRRRIRVLVDTWCELMLRGIDERSKAVNLLQEMYSSAGIEPIRGASTPPDLFDKEMISLYIIGKWGLGVDKDMPPEVFSKIFWVEQLLEKAIDAISKAESLEEVCRVSEDVCKHLDDAFVARILRFAFTKMYFGFSTDEEFRKLLLKIYAILPQFSETIKRFTKFYIAYKVGEKIARGEVRTRMDMSIAKNTIALELSIPKALPSNKYIIEVAKHFFEIPEKLLKEVESQSSRTT